MKFMLVTVLALLSLTLNLFALPSLKGASGLVTMPTAEILEFKEYNMAVDYQLNLEESSRSQHFYKMNVGALENTELGFVGGTDPNEGVFLNFKWNLSANSGRFPLKMAIGLENLTSAKQSDFYIVASKKIQADAGIHGGFKALFEDDIDVSVMLGVDYAYNDKVIFAGDLTSMKDSVYAVNGGAVFKLFAQEGIDNVFAKVTLNNLFKNKGQDSFLNVGLVYTHVL